MKISIIIPTLSEGKNIQKLIYCLKQNSTAENIQEIIIVDACSDDNTADIAERAGAKVFLSEKKGRALQMNIGAYHAEGDILYFLHADTFPPKDFDREIIQRVMNNSDAGCFIMKFDIKHPFLKFFGWLTKFTGAHFRGGDQSLFVTKNFFFEIGGYDSQLLVMEDYDIVRRIKDKTRFAVIKNWITTSARKYEKVGIYRLQLKFGIIMLMYNLGFSQDFIVNYYSRNIEQLC